MFESYFETVKQVLSAVQGVAYVDFTPARLDQTLSPAVFLDLVELDPMSDPGTGQLRLDAQWEARLVMSTKTPKFLQVGLVAEIITALHKHHWPEQDIGQAKIKHVSIDHFQPHLEGQQIWLIEWMQMIQLGDSMWSDEGILPLEIVINESVAC